METEFTQQRYDTLLQDIFRRFPSVQQQGFSDGAYKPGLERMEAFDEALGHPSRVFRSIHIAGTNGKGSVANMLASALGACGLRTGLYTSPHILDFRERMRIGGGADGGRGIAPRRFATLYGKMLRDTPVPASAPAASSPASMVPKEYVFGFLTAWMPWIEEHQLSFFEITTGLAFKWFADSQVDVAVIETGLGGRLDSTNILEPQLSIVTSIGLDHMEQLGHTLAEIAGEKAGIFKAGVPALVGESGPETDPVFNDKAWMFCPLTYADQVRPSLWFRRQAILKEMDLRSSVQEKNLRTVLAAVDLLSDRAGFQALKNAEAVVDGIVHTARYMDFHGRWERLSAQPYVIADIGHNAHALRHNFAQLEAMVSSGQFSSLVIVYGIMADKDLDAILPLMPRDATYIFTAPATPRALPAADLLRRFQAFRASETVPSCPLRAYAAASVREAVQMAVALAQNLSTQLSRSASAESPAPALVYIGGSTFVVAEALPLFKR
ncbi:MAG: bifunctional folylpolyglutamate synthase/dihydrofolate synthase [Bacteroidales bacterium]|nr:bifunctional folylpolyglutamate synthase/dihydrofolate synthase [Bacteroidales bacterium]